MLFSTLCRTGRSRFRPWASSTRPDILSHMTDRSDRSTQDRSPHAKRRQRPSSTAARSAVREENRSARKEEGSQGRHEQEGAASAGAGRGRRTQGGLAPLLQPWWVRMPAVLEAEIAQLEKAGYRTHQEILRDRRMSLVARQGERAYRIAFGVGSRWNLQVFAGAAPPESDSTPYPVSLPLASSLVGRSALWSVQMYERRDPGDLWPASLSSQVLVPPSLATMHEGAGGTLILGFAGPNGPAAALVVTASGETTTARQASLYPAFFALRGGYWMRGTVSPGNDIEQVLLATEERVRQSHGLKHSLDLRTEVLGVASEALPGQRVDWHFFWRTLDGAACVGWPLWLTPDWDLVRAPFGLELRGRRVAIVGCGALGWPIAISLARAGVRSFALYDADLLHPGNLARSGGTLAHIGPKVTALARHIRSLAPTAQIDMLSCRIGDEVDAYGLARTGADLFIDATAESASPPVTNAAALATGRTALYVWASSGVVGARMFRVRPGQTACYACVQNARPRPIAMDPGGGRRPIWSGVNFDLETVAAAATRMAVRTLVNDPIGADNPDHVVLRLGAAVPTARAIHIRRDPRCSVCSVMKGDLA